MSIVIRQIDPSYSQYEELLALIMASFAYMDGVIDPPSSAHRLTTASLTDKARDEIALIAEMDAKSNHGRVSPTVPIQKLAHAVGSWFLFVRRMKITFPNLWASKGNSAWLIPHEMSLSRNAKNSMRSAQIEAI